MKNNNCIVYVLCPANYEAGGADALHQMVYYLNCIDVESKIVYVKKLNEKVSIPERYKIYVDSYILEEDIKDLPENKIIIPEIYTKKRLQYKSCRKYIWWLGINSALSWNIWKKIYFLTTLLIRILIHRSQYKTDVLWTIKSVLKNKESYPFNKEDPEIIHLCASYHALNYVSKRSGNKTLLCIEPISKTFLDGYLRENDFSMWKRKNVILYNPARKYTHILEKISRVAPELIFEPLRGLTQEQLIEKYKTSKLYVDFGAFPGAERIPKEAVLYGCAIITGKRGASGFHGDVSIPEEYKFGNPEKQIKEIVEKIRFMLNNYERIYSDFDEYRNTVLNLEDNFIKSLKDIFLQ